MSDVTDSLEPLRKTIVVPVGQSRAFELFTARIEQWWPLATQAVGRQLQLGQAIRRRRGLSRLRLGLGVRVGCLRPTASN
jgi:hypothetical protein